MLTYLALGVTFGFAAVVQPGPFQAWLIAQSASHGWRRTLPAAFAPLMSDGPIVATTLLVLSHLPPWFAQWLRLAGGAFVLYLAFGSLRAWRAAGRSPADQAPATGRSLIQAATVNLLNPNPWISWSLVMGPLLVKGWREAPSHGIALLAGFYGVMLVGMAATVVLFGMAGALGPRVRRGLVGASALALGAFGGYLLWTGA